MCFVPVDGQTGTYTHVSKPFVQTVQVDKEKLRQIAEILGIPKKAMVKWRPGRVLIVNRPAKKKY